MKFEDLFPVLRKHSYMYRDSRLIFKSYRIFSKLPSIRQDRALAAVGAAFITFSAFWKPQKKPRNFERNRLLFERFLVPINIAVAVVVDFALIDFCRRRR